MAWADAWVLEAVWRATSRPPGTPDTGRQSAREQVPGCRSIKWNWATVRQVAPLTCINIVNVLVGFEALRRVDVPMFLVLRRLTTPTVMLVEWLWTGSVAPRSIRACIALSML